MPTFSVNVPKNVPTAFSLILGEKDPKPPKTAKNGAIAVVWHHIKVHLF